LLLFKAITRVFYFLMSVKNLAEKEMIAIDPPSKQTKTKVKNSLVWIQAIIFLAALSLLFYVIYQIGFQTVIDALKSVGWGFLIIIALNIATP
jgi:hypothetical protein